MTYSKLSPLLVGLALVAGVACSGGDDDALRADTQSIDSSKSEGDDTATGDIDDNEPGDVLGTATSKLPATPLDATLVPLRIDVVALERTDDLVELRLNLTNEGESGTPNFEPYSAFNDERTTSQWDVSGVGLADGEAKKLYLAVLDSDDVCLCSANMGEISIPPGESVELNATYGGVPGDVDKLDVRMPDFPSIEGVPVR